MASTIITPLPDTPRDRSLSRSRALPSRPTTPLRSHSRTSLRASQTTPSGSLNSSTPSDPLAILEPAFSELSDSMADLEANFMHLQLLHESLGRFNENFGAFLYGLNMNAFCVDFPEAPLPASFERNGDLLGRGGGGVEESPFRQRAPPDVGGEQTFLTSDTSFVENPPMSVKKGTTGGMKFSGVPSSAPRDRQTRGGTAAGRGRGAGGSGIARGTSGRGRGTERGRAGSGIGRGIPRGRARA
ncbi:unnamed protein product [Zymoseptoria tritici ST99CH_1A5]|uniref:DASH complex subunit DAM1 n=3 Tax=Zymoseptoria tritici TaxID=1047171 RepID=A0A1X7S6L7_ZYMT9|nr:unnamed protein product [Zymoseptoria tritici ST99CH_3D7]SMR60475.1 unnamed protein product [Zymoseptoria tritici ST99CH_1E4]SMR63588.1 unnamed protein product [Zymoseptoria tritici ST99CH_3D1]SMY28953.1 unnamed protein product [Zymoseptoria tritici ST99CH_1A5]